MTEARPSTELPRSTPAIWLAAVRPKTLWAAVAPVVIGTAMAVETGAFHLLSALLALLGAVLIQIGVNFHNDYADYLKGGDTDARRGPLRVTQAGLLTPARMRQATIFVFGLAVAAGGYLMWRGGLPIVVVGLASIICAVLYTGGKYSLAYLGLGELFVMLFFGPVAVGGTYYVQTLTIDALVVVAGLAPGLLAAAILLVNNIRDVDEDRQSRKKTLVVRLGRRAGIWMYTGCVALAGLLPAALVVLTGDHAGALFAAAVLPLAWPIIRRLRVADDPAALNPLLGRTAQLLLLYSILFSIGW